MKFKYTLSLAVDSIRRRSLRSWLTILGIVIGVASIISLISISIGVSDQITSRVSTLGSNIIQISSGGQQAQRSAGIGALRPPTAGGGFGGGDFGGQRGKTAPLTFSEANDMKTLPGVYKVDARLQERETVSYKDKNTSLTIIGTDPSAFPDSVGSNLTSGRFLGTSDQYSAVIGYGVANSTFQDLEMLNKPIKIANMSFKVVGILNQSSGLGGTDSGIFIPLQTAKKLFNQSSNASQIIVVVSSDHNTTDVATSIENLLITLHHVTATTEDFQLTTAATLQSTIASVTETLGLLLGGIASISLLVGGIGVANTMFMSVLEQTKDIGVLKSIGAKNKDVVLLFLCEAGIIGLIGGILGVLLSFVASAGLGAAGVPTSLAPWLLASGVAFSILIGVIAGVAPARRAAAIPPVEALRYE